MPYETHPAAAPERASADSPRRDIVLICEDDPQVRVLAAQVVEQRLGRPLILAANAEEALAEAQAHQPTVVLTDLIMPGLQGLDLIAALRACVPNASIIAMTGFSPVFSHVEVVEAGADDFIRKPFPLGELEAKLMRVFREQALRRAQAMAEWKYRSLFDLNMDGMLLLESPDQIISDANQAFRDLCERTHQELTGTRVFDLFTQIDHARLEQWLLICARSGKGTMADLTIPTPGGRNVHVDVTATFINVDDSRIVFLSFKDVTEKVIIEQQLAEAAQKDALTGLFNKRSFQNRLEASIARARDRGLPLALVFIDLDNFKQVNDKFGHQVGDRLLVSVGEVIAKSTRATADDGFRLGGDEFSVILLGADRANSMNVAERMRTEFERINSYGTTMSVGVVPLTGDLKAETLVRAADAALYKAKGAGKNTIHID